MNWFPCFLLKIKNLSSYRLYNLLSIIIEEYINKAYIFIKKLKNSFKNNDNWHDVKIIVNLTKQFKTSFNITQVSIKFSQQNLRPKPLQSMQTGQSLTSVRRPFISFQTKLMVNELSYKKEP